MSIHQTAGVWISASGGSKSFNGDVNCENNSGTLTFSAFDFGDNGSSLTMANDDDPISMTNTSSGSPANWTSVMEGYVTLNGGAGNYDNYLAAATLTAYKPHTGGQTVHLVIYDCNQTTGVVLSTVLWDSGVCTPSSGLSID